MRVARSMNTPSGSGLKEKGNVEHCSGRQVEFDEGGAWEAG